MNITKPATFTTQLPATPCTDEMREKIIEIAQNNGVSIANIQRNAFALFLDSFASKSSTNDRDGYTEDQSA